MSTQLDLFRQAEVEVREPEPKTDVRLGSRRAWVNSRQKRREALEKLLEVLIQLEGKDVHIAHCGGPRTNFWIDNLKLGRMRVEHPMFANDQLPSTIVLRGNRGGYVRIFTDRVVNLRCQEYLGYTLWLLDFWNGWGEYPIDRYRMPGYDSLCIKRFRD